MNLIIIRPKRSRGGLIAGRSWERDVQVGTIRRARRESKVLTEREPVAVVETTREEVEEDKRSRRVFSGDLVREITRMALRKDRGRGPDVDNSISIPGQGQNVRM